MDLSVNKVKFAVLIALPEADVPEFVPLLKELSRLSCVQTHYWSGDLLEEMTDEQRHAVYDAIIEPSEINPAILFQDGIASLNEDGKIERATDDPGIFFPKGLGFKNSIKEFSELYRIDPENISVIENRMKNFPFLGEHGVHARDLDALVKKLKSMAP